MVMEMQHFTFCVEWKSLKTEFSEFIRETKELDINKFNRKGETPLHIACRWSSGDVVEALVAMKCDVNACDGLGNTALHIAVCSGIDRLQKVQCLLESGKCANMDIHQFTLSVEGKILK